MKSTKPAHQLAPLDAAEAKQPIAFPVAAIIVLGCLNAIACLVWLLGEYDFLPTAADQVRIFGLWQLFGIAIVLWGFLSLLAWHLYKNVSQTETLPVLPNVRIGLLIVIVAAIARVLIVLNSSPAMSDDIWRYIHDGAMQQIGVNPYAYAPADIPVDQTPIPAIFDEINHPKLVTIYQPTSQFAFGILSDTYTLLPEVWQAYDPLRDKTFRLGFVAMELLAILMLLGILHTLGRSAWWAALYAWHPLPMIEIAGSGHQDAIGLPFLLGGLWLFYLASRLGQSQAQRLEQTWWQRMPLVTYRRSMIGSILFAFAIAVKPILALASIPAMMRLFPRIDRMILAPIVMILTVILLYLPFAMMRHGLDGMFHTVWIFTANWAFNSSIHQLLYALIEHKTSVDILCLLALCWVTLRCMLMRRYHAMGGACVILFAMLLLSSTVYPWYLLWALVLLPTWFMLPLWIWSVTILLSYVALWQPTYDVPWPWLLVEYAPVYAALLWVIFPSKKNTQRDSSREKAHSANV